MRLACAVLPLCLALFASSAQAEVFTATSGFKQLLAYETLLFQTLHKFIAVTEFRLTELKKYTILKSYNDVLAKKKKIQFGFYTGSR